VLDWAHLLVLRAVSQGHDDDSPALRTLVATGLVERRADDSHVVTAAGQIALDAGRSSRGERVAWRVLAVCALLVIAGQVVDWVT
jgi:hypothetical protein